MPGTPPVLDVIVEPNEQILLADMAQMIHHTIEEIQNIINAHDASGKPLYEFHDPFISSEMWPGCFIEVKSKRRNRQPGRNEHFTVGALVNVLRGLWSNLYEDGRYCEATVNIFDDR